MDFVGRDLFTAPLENTLRQFEEANNFGSLIRPDVTDVAGMLGILESKRCLRASVPQPDPPEGTASPAAGRLPEPQIPCGDCQSAVHGRRRHEWAAQGLG